jgi:hypothetical protein
MARPVCDLKEGFNAYPLDVLLMNVASHTEIDAVTPLNGTDIKSRRSRFFTKRNRIRHSEDRAS